jgi:predicted nucleotidyltransferase
VDVEGLTRRLTQIPGVVAVCLGGSRARGEARPESDWDFGLYYRGRIDTEAVRALGFPGEVVEPGAWGRLVNGGAWLEVDGERVDLLYRDLDAVEHWLREAESGRFEVDPVPGYIAGMATYVLVGELALNRVLHGDLPRPEFPAALQERAPGRWWGRAAFFLLYADGNAKRGEVTACTGALAVAVMAAAQARLAERGEWALNEKGLVQRAVLGAADRLLAAAGGEADELVRTVAEVRALLGLHPPRGRSLDAVVRGEPSEHD